CYRPSQCAQGVSSVRAQSLAARDEKPSQSVPPGGRWAKPHNASNTDWRATFALAPRERPHHAASAPPAHARGAGLPGRARAADADASGAASTAPTVDAL